MSPWTMHTLVNCHLSSLWPLSIRPKSFYNMNGPTKSASAIAPSEYGYSYGSSGKGYGRPGAVGEGGVELVTVPAMGQEYVVDCRSLRSPVDSRIADPISFPLHYIRL
jgi:hypothetical protein